MITRYVVATSATHARSTLNMRLLMEGQGRTDPAREDRVHEDEGKAREALAKLQEAPSSSGWAKKASVWLVQSDTRRLPD